MIATACKLEARAFTRSAASAADWDAVVARGWNGTFMHTRRFLAYHRERFVDASVEVVDDTGAPVAVLPAAVDPANPARVISHPGATYGGLVHDGALTGSAMLDAFRAIAGHYRDRGFRAFRYKVVPSIYHAVPAADDTYALFRLGAVRQRCDLSSTIDLDHRRSPSTRRRRSVRQAVRAGIDTAAGPALLADVWRVVEENLATRHSRRPVHTLAEMDDLRQRFPDTIQVRAALADDRVVAGLVLYHVHRTVHAQYIATRFGEERGALDLLIESAIDEAKRCGARYFDFGISNEEEGRVLNEGLHQFKTEFGAGTTPYEHYELALIAPGA